MILVVGGAGQGKLRFARELSGSADGDAPDAAIFDKLHLAVRDCLREGGDLSALAEKALQSRVVVCDEIGCGIVPLDREERRWREETGRLCQALAREAEAVYRVVCGIPVCLKRESRC